MKYDRHYSNGIEKPNNDKKYIYFKRDINTQKANGVLVKCDEWGYTMLRIDFIQFSTRYL